MKILTDSLKHLLHSALDVESEDVWPGERDCCVNVSVGAQGYGDQGLKPRGASWGVLESLRGLCRPLVRPVPCVGISTTVSDHRAIPPPRRQGEPGPRAQRNTLRFDSFDFVFLTSSGTHCTHCTHRTHGTLHIALLGAASGTLLLPRGRSSSGLSLVLTSVWTLPPWVFSTRPLIAAL
ncbi:hypothetical protein ANO11243_065800 [Dothideomycetidae sp. 11243]|nr:hypothetical protein ANO11243_065800 [fungal sp. No.11243]